MATGNTKRKTAVTDTMTFINFTIKQISYYFTVFSTNSMIFKVPLKIK